MYDALIFLGSMLAGVGGALLGYWITERVMEWWDRRV